MSVVSKGFSSLCVGPVAVLVSAPPKLPGEWKVAVGDVDTLDTPRAWGAWAAGRNGISCACDILAMLYAMAVWKKGRERGKGRIII